MSQYIQQHKQQITRYLLAAFVVSWFGFIGQVNAHALMLLEKQQHQAMGHHMTEHCPTVTCESILSLHDQINYGLDTQSVVDLNSLPAPLAGQRILSNRHTIPPASRRLVIVDPPPIEITGLLRV